MSSTPAPDDLEGRVALDGDGALRWRHVSPALATVRTLVVLAVAAPLLAVAVVLAVVLSAWAWTGAGVVVLGTAWALWVVRRQVSAITWVELPEELVIRKGRLLRRLVSIPYGRLQYVDLQSGPLARRFGLAGLELHTASPESGGDIPGVPVADAEALRERLAARGESFRAGL